LLCVLLHQHVYAQEKPDTSFNKVQDTLSLRSKDTDGDGVNDDGDKCINEKGPASNFGCPVIDATRGGCHLNLGYVVFFEKGVSKLSQEAIDRLNKVVKILKDDPKLYIGLSGHTDSVGNHNLNMKLAKRRMEVVKSFLLFAGINEDRFLYKTADGSRHPIDDDRTKAGRTRNRRVEITMNFKEYLY